MQNSVQNFHNPLSDDYFKRKAKYILNKMYKCSALLSWISYAKRCAAL